MSWCRCEPTLEEILSDPIVASVMAADAVDVCELDAMLSQIAGELHAAVDDNVVLGAAAAVTPPVDAASAPFPDRSR